MENMLILFGAGNRGKDALREYGKERVVFWCDNSIEKQGTYIEGIEVISFEKMLDLHKMGYSIMITPINNKDLILQLELEGVSDYLVFHGKSEFNILEEKIKTEKDYKTENVLLDTYVKRTQKYDLLQDVREFIKITKEAISYCQEKNITMVHKGIRGEGHYYGNTQCLLEYADIFGFEEIYLPDVSHHACFPVYDVEFQHNTAVIVSGTHFRRKIHQRRPYVPVFSVGPYIHYTKGIYTDEKLTIEKEKNGKTLVVFLPHSLENIDRLYSKKEYLDIIKKKFGNQFKTILLCVYWADMSEELYKYAQDRGMRLITSGFRFDSAFNKRQKTILELADAVVCGDIGSFVAYSIYKGIPIARVGISNNTTLLDLQLKSEMIQKVQYDDYYKKYEQEFYSIFDDNFRNSNEQYEWMNDLAGFDQVRSKNYIKCIFEISRDIWKRAEGKLNKYPEAVRKVYKDYERKGLFYKMSILREATEGYVEY